MSRVMLRVGESLPASTTQHEPVWLHQIAEHRELQLTDRWPYGCWSLEVGFQLFRGARPDALQRHRVIEAWLAGIRIWSGYIDAVDHGAGTITASGFAREAETAKALGGTLEATTNLGLAIFYASNLMRGAVNFGSLETPESAAFEQLAPPTEESELWTLMRLADEWCKINGRRWKVDADRLWSTAPDPTTPVATIATDEQLGVSDLDEVNCLIAEYQDSADSKWKRVIADRTPRAARLEATVSLAAQGMITATKAQQLANQMLAGRGKPALSGSITVGPGQVTGMGGQALHLSQVMPGRVYRITGQTDPRDASLALDVLMGERVWNEDESTVQLTPIDADRDDLQAVIERLGGSLVA